MNQVSVPALDMERSIAFYRALGLSLIVKSEHYARFELPEGGATFSLEKVEDAAGAAGGPHVYFECDDLDDRVAALKAKGIAFESGPEDKRWLWREAWLNDPSGVRLCLFRAGDNRLNPPWRLKE